jgi:hypothetical protein
MTHAKNSREKLRNERAENTYRELRYFLMIYGTPGHAEYDIMVLHNLLLKWMAVAKKNQYTRP